MKVAAPQPVSRGAVGCRTDRPSACSSSGRDAAAASSSAMEAALRIRRMRQVSQTNLESKVNTRRDAETARQKMLRKAKSCRDVTRRGSIDRLLANDAKALPSNQSRKGLGQKLALDRCEEDDEKSFASMGSLSSCGSIGTIGSTNSLRESFKDRRAQSARNVLHSKPTSIHPKQLILPSPMSSMRTTQEDDEEEDDRAASSSKMLRYCISNHIASKASS